MKSYDFNKAIHLINESKDCIESASLGMHEDWFWTAETIFGNGIFIKELKNNDEIACLNSSEWATPTLQLIFNDGEDKMIPCYYGDGIEIPFGEKIDKMVFWTGGCLSSEVQLNITDLEPEK